MTNDNYIDTGSSGYRRPTKRLTWTAGIALRWIAVIGCCARLDTTEAAVVASDNFDRADADTLGSSWTTLAGTTPYPITGHLVIATNQAGANAVDVGCYSYWNANTFSADQYSEATIPTTANFTSVIVRAGGASTVN